MLHALIKRTVSCMESYNIVLEDTAFASMFVICGC